MATYKEIAKWVKKHHGVVPKTCWIAHCKELKGLPVTRAPNRNSDRREVPCPKTKQKPIFDAFCHFGMIQS